MRTIGLLGVPTNSAGTTDGVARAPQALREADLIDVLSRHAEVHDYGDVTLPEPSPGSRRQASLAGGVEQLHKIPGRILEEDLLASRPR